MVWTPLPGDSTEASYEAFNRTRRKEEFWVIHLGETADEEFTVLS